jgi:hypothetical protein
LWTKISQSGRGSAEKKARPFWSGRVFRIYL